MKQNQELMNIFSILFDNEWTSINFEERRLDFLSWSPLLRQSTVKDAFVQTEDKMVKFWYGQIIKKRKGGGEKKKEIL